MAPRKQPRSIARELALLSLSQVNASSDKLEEVEIPNLLLAAVRTLTLEIQEILEAAASEVRRGSDRLAKSETHASDVKSAKVMVNDAVDLTQTAINRLGIAVELPEFIYLANQKEVQQYAIEIIGAIGNHRQQIKEEIESVLVAWQFERLPKIDRDILRIAVAEILFLDLPVKVAINEAVEIAKRYSDDEGHRFINGVLRRFSDRLQQEKIKS
jgi:N utilization substance protein B